MRAGPTTAELQAAALRLTGEQLHKEAPYEAARPGSVERVRALGVRALGVRALGVPALGVRARQVWALAV